MTRKYLTGQKTELNAETAIERIQIQIESLEMQVLSPGHQNRRKILRSDGRNRRHKGAEEKHSLPIARPYRSCSEYRKARQARECEGSHSAELIAHEPIVEGGQNES